MSTCKPVIATCIRTGTVVRFPSVYAVQVEGFGKELVTNCLKGRAHHHGGFTWAYEGEGAAVNQPTDRMITMAALRNKGLTNAEAAKEMGITVNWARVLAGRCITAGLCESRMKRGVQ